MGNKNTTLALATLIGGTLGAGLFGVPYVFAHAGVLQGTLRTIFIGVCIIILNLLQAEISLSMPKTFRLAALMRKILPGNLGFVGVFVTCMQFFIAIFAYISLIGGFLSIVMGPAHALPPAITATIYSLVMGLFLFKGFNSIKKYDKIIVTLFICTLLFVIIYGFSITTATHYLVNDFSNRFLPYGVLIYCLNSVTSIPLIEDLLGRGKKELPYIIIIGGIICMCMVLLRGRAVVGISGGATSPDALSGLQIFLPTWIMKLAGVVGILALISPHLIIGEHLKETLEQTFRFRGLDAWATVVLVPLLAYLYLQSDFVGTIGFSGAIFTGLTCVFVGVMNLILHAQHGKKETHILPYSKFFSYLIIGIFSLGIAYECFKQFLL